MAPKYSAVLRNFHNQREWREKSNPRRGLWIHGLNELILDNASCQGGLRDWIEESGYKSQGFASARRNLQHLDATYQEIIDVNGEGIHYVDDVSGVEQD